MVSHKDKLYPGQHEAIIEAQAFDVVQAIFQSHAVQRSTRRVKTENRVSEQAFLTGLIYCGCCGSAMTPSFCSKGDIRYRYYRCYRRARKLDDKCPISQIRASEIERVVMEQILSILKTREFFIKYISTQREIEVSTIHSLFCNLDNVWDCLFETEKIRILQELVSRITVYKDRITIDVKKSGLSNVFAELMENNKIAGIQYHEGDTFQISVNYVGKRLPNGAKIIIPATAPQENRFNGSLTLARHFAKAYDWQKKLASGWTLQEIYSSEKINERDIRFALRISLIDPEIIEAVLGRTSSGIFNLPFYETTSHTVALERPAQTLWL